MNKIKLSQSTFVYFRYPLDEAIRRLAHFGYDGVEIWGGRPHAYWEDMDDNRCSKIRKALNETGLEISNFIPAQFRYPTNLATTDEQIRKHSVDYIKKNIDAAEKFESPYVSLCPGFSLYGEKKEHSYNAMMKSFEELIQYSKKKNLKLLIEPAHAMETDHVLTVDDGIKVVDALGKENMGLCIDTGHMFVNKESLVNVAEKIQGYTVHYHIDDNMGNSDDHLVPGEGKINFDLFISNLIKYNYTGFLTLELGWNYTPDPDIAVKKSIDYLKSKF